MAKQKTVDLAARIRDLPPGTKERDAKAALAPKMDDAEFRELWLAERIGPAKQEGKRTKQTAKAPDPRPVPLTNTGE